MIDKIFLHKLSMIRLGEFDLGGVLYHANYFHLYEEAREALLAENGVPYPSLVGQNIHLALSESSQKFRKPVFYGDVLDIALSAADLTRTTVLLNYHIQKIGDDSPLHLASTRLVHVENIAGRFRPTRFSEELYRIFSKYLQE